MLSQVVVKLFVQIMLLAVFARQLSIEEFGIATVAISIYNISWFFFKTGLENAIIQRPNLLDSKKNQGLLSAAWVIAILIAIVAPLLMWGVAYIASEFLNLPELNKILKIFVPVVFIRSMSIVPEALIKKKLEVSVSVSIEIFSLLVGLTSTSVYLAYSGFGYWSWPVGIAIYNVIGSFLYIVIGFKKFHFYFSLSAIKEMMYYSIGYALSTVTNTLTVEIDKLIVQSALGTVATSIYARATQIYLLPAGVLGQIIEGALFPSLSHAKAEAKKIEKSLLIGKYLLSVTVLPASALFFVLAENIVFLLLGSKWSGVILPLKILTAGMYFRSAVKVYETIISSQGGVYIRVGLYVINLLVVTSALILLSKFGMVGISFALVISSFIFYVIMAIFTIKTISIKYFEVFKEQLSGMAIAFVLLVFGCLIHEYISYYEISSILTVLIILIIELFLYAICFYLFAWRSTPLIIKNYVKKIFL